MAPQGMQPPSMGVNGFGRRSHNFSSQPSLADYRGSHYGSQPTIVQNGNHSPPNYAQLFEQPVVVLRAKKPSTVRSAKEESRLRSQQPPNNMQRVQATRSRPQSTTSYNSLASSGLENIHWRNSALSFAPSDHRRHTMYDEEDSPRVARLEFFQCEESDMLKRGQEQATKLMEWYKERMQSVQKKARLLQQGSVSLDPAVHEQKLNFLRAHITELNRRVVALMETSDKGFPSHQKQPSVNGAASSSANEDQLVWLHRQNRRLNQEVAEKTHLIEQLKRENELAKKKQQHIERQVPLLRPSAFVRPAYQVQTSSLPPQHPSPHKIYDTLM